MYTKEFREQAVRWVLEESLSIPQAGQRLSMVPKTLANEVGAALGGRQPSLTESEREVTRLRRELAEVKMERDILKKAAAYFA